jgi:hypothetical protein
VHVLTEWCETPKQAAPIDIDRPAVDQLRLLIEMTTSPELPELLEA